MARRLLPLRVNYQFQGAFLQRLLNQLELTDTGEGIELLREIAAMYQRAASRPEGCSGTSEQFR